MGLNTAGCEKFINIIIGRKSLPQPNNKKDNQMPTQNAYDKTLEHVESLAKLGNPDGRLSYNTAWVDMGRAIARQFPFRLSSALDLILEWAEDWNAHLFCQMITFVFAPERGGIYREYVERGIKQYLAKETIVLEQDATGAYVEKRIRLNVTIEEVE